METKTDQYIPGVCNIGPVEIAQRKKMGWIGAVTTLALWVLLDILHAAPAWRLLLFFPATLSASGFIQAYSHFCLGFGLKGVFNFGSQLNKTTDVQQEEFRAADRKKALQFIAYAAGIGALVVLVTYIF